MTLSNRRTAAIGLGVLLALVFLAFSTQRTVARLRQENAALRREAAQAAQFREELDRLGRTNAATTSALERDRTELLRLRAEVTRLRRQLKDTASAPSAQPVSLPGNPATSAPTPPAPTPPTGADDGFLPADQWVDAGFGTPEAAFQTLQWAMRHGNQERMQQAFLIAPGAVPEGAQSIGVNLMVQPSAGGNGPVAIPAEALSEAPVTTQMPELTGSRILTQQNLGPDEAQLTVENLHADGTRLPAQLNFRKVGSEWKLAPTVIQVPATGAPGSP